MQRQRARRPRAFARLLVGVPHEGATRATHPPDGTSCSVRRACRDAMTRRVDTARVHTSAVPPPTTPTTHIDRAWSCRLLLTVHMAHCACTGTRTPPHTHIHMDNLWSVACNAQPYSGLESAGEGRTLAPRGDKSGGPESMSWIAAESGRAVWRRTRAALAGTHCRMHEGTYVELCCGQRGPHDATLRRAAQGALITPPHFLL